MLMGCAPTDTFVGVWTQHTVAMSVPDELASETVPCVRMHDRIELDEDGSFERVIRLPNTEALPCDLPRGTSHLHSTGTWSIHTSVDHQWLSLETTWLHDRTWVRGSLTDRVRSDDTTVEQHVVWHYEQDDGEFLWLDGLGPFARRSH